MIDLPVLDWEAMQSMEILSVLTALLLISALVELSMICFFSLIGLWSKWRKWRTSVAFQTLLVPTLEDLVPLPPPSPALVWAVRWDLDIRALVDDLKSEGPDAAERYLQNEAFVNKLSKIVRNVVPQREMDRITLEVKRYEQLQRFHAVTERTTARKTAEAEDEDAKALAAMMAEISGAAPTGPTGEIDTCPSSQFSEVPGHNFADDDAATMEALQAVMNRRPGDSATSQFTNAPVQEPSVDFAGDDAAAWGAMMAVMNRKPGDSQPCQTQFQDDLSQNTSAPIEESAPSFEGDDAAAWEAMMAVMGRKPGDSEPCQTRSQDDASTQDSTTCLQSEDAAALEALMAAVGSKPGDGEPSQVSVAPVENPAPLASDDAATWEAMLAVMNNKPGGQAVPDTEGHDAFAPGSGAVMRQASDRRPDTIRDFEEFWADLDIHTGSALPSTSTWKLVSLCMRHECQDNAAHVAQELLSSLAQHFFIGDSVEEQDSSGEELDSLAQFWADLDLRPELVEEPEQAWKLISLCGRSDGLDFWTGNDMRTVPSQHLLTGVDDYALDERHNPEEALLGQKPSVSAESRVAFWGDLQPEVAGEP